MSYYLAPVNCGLDAVFSLGDGYTIAMRWFRAYPTVKTNSIAYHIYYATVKSNVFSEGVKFISVDDALEINIIDLIPGQEYYFSVRPVEYDSNIYDLTAILPVAYDNVRFYPTSLLREDMTATETVVPLIDVEGFPAAGVVKVGVELIQYSSIDQFNKNLIVSGSSTASQSATLHIDNYTFSGSDGYIQNLTLADNDISNINWSIQCIASNTIDSYGNIVPGTAEFIAVPDIMGAISNTILHEGYYDGYYQDGYEFKFGSIVWKSNNVIRSNGILSFSIFDGYYVDGYNFNIGDYVNITTLSSVDGSTATGRGFGSTYARSHSVDGYDGYYNWNPIVSVFTKGEDQEFDRIYVSQCRFEYPNNAFTKADGYKQVLHDTLSTDLTASDALNVTFPMYDYAGYHRTNPSDLLDGTCVGSYIGGEQGCIDAYGNVQMVRGFSLQEQNNQRQEMLLNVDGRPVVLVKRVQTGIVCACYNASSEYPDDRCPFCYGTKFVFGYEQYFNPRRSDGRILVRPGPTEENLKMYEAGLESEFPVDLWTLTVPTIKTRDVLVMFDIDDNEEFRYEVMGVTRNNTVAGLQGGQKFKALRIRKTDPAYQIRVFRNTAEFPSKLNTSIGFTPGIVPHLHSITINQDILTVSQINQTTAVAQGHNHPIINGVVMTVLGHDHKIILP